MLYTQLLEKFQPKTNVFARWQGWFPVCGLFMGAFLSFHIAIAGFADRVAAAGLETVLPDVAAQAPPDLSLAIVGPDGEQVSINDYKGTSLLVNFWAIWCPPCVAELPALERAAGQLAPKSIDVLLISVDRGGAAKALPFLEERGVLRPALGFDPKGALARQLEVTGLPTTFLLSADQTKSWKFVGPFEWDKPELQRQLETLLAQ